MAQQKSEQNNMFNAVVTIVLVLLAIGQVVLYRNMQHLNRLTSEGIIQIKEQQQELLQEPTMMEKDEVTR